jgi:hypothetical protein
MQTDKLAMEHKSLGSICIELGEHIRTDSPWCRCFEKCLRVDRRLLNVRISAIRMCHIHKGMYRGLRLGSRSGTALALL